MSGASAFRERNQWRFLQYHGNITDLSSLAAEFGFTQLLSQIEARGPRFSAARSATWGRENIHQLIARLPDATLPDIQILYLNPWMQELRAR
jgi:hypothetical protein